LIYKKKSLIIFENIALNYKHNLNLDNKTKFNIKNKKTKQ